MGEGTQTPITPDAIRKEFANLAEIIIQGGILAECGPVTEVLGVRLVTSYALTVEAPELTWSELHRKTMPDTAEVEPPTRPQLRDMGGAPKDGTVVQGKFDPHRQNKRRYEKMRENKL